MMTRTTSTLLLLGALLSAPLALAGEAGNVIRKTDLRQKPFLDAAIIMPVAANTAVEILERKGSWMRVRASGREGWVKLLSVRSGSSSTNGGATLAQLGRVVTTGSSGRTTTAGVKGWSEEDLDHTQPNIKELARLKTLAVSAPDAARSAAQAKLVAVKVADISVSSSSSSNRDNSERPNPNGIRRP